MYLIDFCRSVIYIYIERERERETGQYLSLQRYRKHFSANKLFVCAIIFFLQQYMNCIYFASREPLQKKLQAHAVVYQCLCLSVSVRLSLSLSFSLSLSLSLSSLSLFSLYIYVIYIYTYLYIHISYFTSAFSLYLNAVGYCRSFPGNTCVYTTLTHIMSVDA